MAEKFPKFIKTGNIQIPEAPQSPSRRNRKKTVRYTKIKLLKIVTKF